MSAEVKFGFSGPCFVFGLEHNSCSALHGTENIAEKIHCRLFFSGKRAILMGLRPGHSAVGSASALGAEGREFESRCPDQLDLPIHQELTPDGFFLKKLLNV